MTEHNNPQDNVTVPRELLRQVLEALTYCEALNRSVEQQKMQAITALRTLLDAPTVEQEPIGEIVTCDDHGHPWKRIEYRFPSDIADLPIGTKVYAAPQAQQPTPVQEPENLQCKTVQKRLATQWGLHDLVEISSRENEASTIIHLSN